MFGNSNDQIFSNRDILSSRTPQEAGLKIAANMLYDAMTLSPEEIEAERRRQAELDRQKAEAQRLEDQQEAAEEAKLTALEQQRIAALREELKQIASIDPSNTTALNAAAMRVEAMVTHWRETASMAIQTDDSPGIETLAEGAERQRIVEVTQRLEDLQEAVQKLALQSGARLTLTDDTPFVLGDQVVTPVGQFQVLDGATVSRGPDGVVVLDEPTRVSFTGQVGNDPSDRRTFAVTMPEGIEFTLEEPQGVDGQPARRRTAA